MVSANPSYPSGCSPNPICYRNLSILTAVGTITLYIQTSSRDRLVHASARQQSILCWALFVLGPIWGHTICQPGPVLPQAMPLQLAEPGTGQNKAGRWLGLPIDYKIVDISQQNTLSDRVRDGRLSESGL